MSWVGWATAFVLARVFVWSVVEPDQLTDPAWMRWGRALLTVVAAMAFIGYVLISGTT